MVVFDQIQMNTPRRTILASLALAIASMNHDSALPVVTAAWRQGPSRDRTDVMSWCRERSEMRRWCYSIYSWQEDERCGNARQNRKCGNKQKMLAICLTLDVLGLIKQDETSERLFIRQRNITKGFFFLLTQMRSDGTDETRWSLGQCSFSQASLRERDRKRNEWVEAPQFKKNKTPDLFFMLLFYPHFT